MADFEWDPDTYLEEILDEVPGFRDLQAAVGDAVAEAAPRSVLELGTGTGETARAVLERLPSTRWTGIDASEPMLAHARERLPDADLRLGRLEDPLPPGPFDLAVSVLAVHHLDGEGKRSLFARVASVAPAFVLGDVVVPERPEDAVVEIDWVMDTPSSVPDQLEWLAEAGYDATASLVRPDLAVFEARRRSR